VVYRTLDSSVEYNTSIEISHNNLFVNGLHSSRVQAIYYNRLKGLLYQGRVVLLLEFCPFKLLSQKPSARKCVEILL